MARWWPTALERRIALRYLRGQRGTRSASLQTVVAIGGIQLNNAAEVTAAGADGLAVVSAICSADDPAEAARAMLRGMSGNG